MMSEKDFNAIIAQNLSYYLTQSGKTQNELAKYIGVSTASVSNWCNGIKIPRMDKINAICKFFNILRSELMEESGPQNKANREIEETLLSKYNRLNVSGKKKVIEYASDLSLNPAYSISSSVFSVVAAHERTDVPVDDEMRQHDTDLMNDDDEWK